MSNSQGDPVLELLTQRALPLAQLPDARLLESFHLNREEAAFEALLDKHGPMVWNVCRRVLRETADVEDVFQATFLVLSQKAGSLKKPGSLGSWLHGVAFRLALKVVRKNRPTLGVEEVVDSGGEAGEQAVRLEDRQALDEELEGLPGDYREAVVVCCLEGCSREEAARRMGWTLSKLKVCLQKGRELLRARLTRRGVAVPALLVGTEVVSAAIPSAVRAAVVSAAVGLLDGSVDSVVISERVWSLSRGAVLAMSSKPTKTVVAVLAFVGLLGTATVLLGALQQGKPPALPVSVAKAPKEDVPPRGPEVEVGKTVAMKLPKIASPVVALSPDGKRLAAPMAWWYASTAIDMKTGKRTWMRSRALEHRFGKKAGIVLNSYGQILDVGTGQPAVRLEGKTGRILAARYSRDGKLIVTGSGDKSVRVWDAETGKQLARLEGHTGRVRDVAFDDEAKLVISGAEDGFGRIWDWRAGKSLFTLAGHQKMCLSVGFGLGGKRAITIGLESTGQIWDTETGKPLAKLLSQSGMRKLVVSPDGKLAVTYLNYGSSDISVWDMETGKRLRTLGAGGAPDEVQFSADGKRVVTCGIYASVWEVATGKRIASLKAAKKSESVVFHPKRDEIVGVLPQQLVFWDAKTGLRKKTIMFRRRKLKRVAVSPDGGTVVVTEMLTQVGIWDVPSKKLLRELRGGHQWQIWDMEFSPDGKRLVTASLDQTACLWDVTTGERVAELRAHRDRVKYGTFSPSGKYLLTATGQNHCSAYLWDAQTGQLLHELKSPTDHVELAVFSADEKRLVTGSDDNKVRVWDVATGKELFAMEHGSTITTVQFSGDGKHILTASSGYISWYTKTPDGRRLNPGSGPSKEHSARVWDADTGRLKFELAHPSGVVASYSSDGKHIFTASAGVVRYWDASNGKEVGKVKEGKPAKVVFSPDRQRFVVSVRGEPMELWDMVTRKKLRTFEEMEVYKVFFSGDGRRVVAFERDGAFRMWPLVVGGTPGK